MELIEGAVKKYDWGSLTAIPDLLGRPPTGEPWAELWFGAHPASPATVGARAELLDQLIAADPVAALGPAVASRFGRLPFLLKVLAAAAPLSLQAHPSAEHAEAGFARGGVLLEAAGGGRLRHRGCGTSGTAVHGRLRRGQRADLGPRRRGLGGRWRALGCLPWPGHGVLR
ncbi:MAG: hypothetical protein F4110_06210 [Acidimicrobiaceae bacterium]|nr:hypothetical protein [Acidimicrobiaceae bacterium]MYE97256.1 hypothetical protein [Acidimicrobiaceae bacterium]MYI53559.1 hypothetical protein [Acidimicrobiaceae bacterium]